MFLKRCLWSLMTLLSVFTASYAEALEKNDDIDASLEYVLKVPHDYIGYAKEAVKRDYLQAYLIGAGVFGASMLLDEPIRDYFQRDRPLADVIWLRDKYLGSLGPYNTMYAGMFFSGHVFDKKGFSDTAVMGFEKLILDVAICGLLKNNVDRSRPNDRNNDSFTSGHTTPPASFASTISTMSDWNPWVTGISYSISIFTGFCDIDKNQHWFSDIAASHVFTTLTAIPMSKYWKSKDVIILPDVGDEKTGVIAVFRF